MIRKTILLLSFALCVLGDGHHAVSEQHIKIEHKEKHGHHGEMAHIGPKEPEHHEEYAWSYPSYEFSYSVHDPHTHDEKGQKESREGDDVKGEYWLIEPDGRKRTVTYNADKHSGFNAIVHYSDKHHHIYEHHGKKKEEGKKEEEGGEEGNGEEGGEAEAEVQEQNEGGNEENAGEEEGGEEGRGGAESRSGGAGIVRWGYGPKWDDSYKASRYGYKNNRDENRDRSRGHVENYGHDVYRKGGEGRRKEEERHDDDHKYDIDSITVLGNMGSYGRRDDKKKDEGRWRDDRRGGYEEHDEGRDREEGLLLEERRKFDERRGYPSHITPYRGHASRINPRFYRHYRGQRETNTRH